MPHDMKQFDLIPYRPTVFEGGDVYIEDFRQDGTVLWERDFEDLGKDPHQLVCRVL